MEREIKFRYIFEDIKEDGRSLVTQLWNLNDIETNDIVYDTEVLIARNQYTGLKDKNGVEIYEGDIVTIKGDERKFYLRWFDDMCFAFVDVRSDYVKTFYSCYNTSNGFPIDKWIEVIGNIYENQNLLKG